MERDTHPVEPASNLILIRHAESIYNIKDKEIKVFKEDDPERYKSAALKIG